MPDISSLRRMVFRPMPNNRIVLETEWIGPDLVAYTVRDELGVFGARAEIVREDGQLGMDYMRPMVLLQ